MQELSTKNDLDNEELLLQKWLVLKREAIRLVAVKDMLGKRKRIVKWNLVRVGKRIQKTTYDVKSLGEFQQEYSKKMKESEAEGKETDKEETELRGILLQLFQEMKTNISLVEGVTGEVEDLVNNIEEPETRLRLDVAHLQGPRNDTLLRLNDYVYTMRDWFDKTKENTDKKLQQLKGKSSLFIFLVLWVVFFV